jgi:predicted N-acetyltransferase YhbS
MSDVRIEFLCDRSGAAETLARWHAGEWAHLYPGMTAAMALRDLRGHSGRERVPTTLVALERDEPIGCVSLIEDDLPGCTGYNPWLASFYVRPDRRAQGVGSSLVDRMRGVIRALGLRDVYLFTETRQDYFARRGWTTVETAACNGHPVTIMKTGFSGSCPGETFADGRSTE